MGPNFLGLVFGAFIGVLIVSRIVVWIATKLINDRRTAILVAYAILFPALFFLPALGAANGGPLVWSAGLVYMPITALFLLFDLYRANRPKA